MTKNSDITTKSPADLATFVAEKREELRQMRFASAGSRGRDVKKMREAKKDVARGLTALNATK